MGPREIPPFFRPELVPAPHGEGESRRFFSLKWTVTLALSLVLVGMTAGLALFGQKHMRARYEQESRARWQQHVRQLTALIQQGYDELQQVASLTTLAHESQEDVVAHLQASLHEYASAVAPAWPLEAAVFYHPDGSERFVWHENPAELASLAQASRGLDQPFNTVLCLPLCRQYSAVPLIRQHRSYGVLILGRSLADVLQNFHLVSSADAALFLPQQHDGATMPRPVAAWSGHLSLATSAERTYQVVQQAAASHSLWQLRQNSVLVRLGQQDFELHAMPVRLGERSGEAHVIFVQDATEAMRDLTRTWRQSLLLGLAGTLAAELLLLGLLWGPVRRLRQLAGALPLLAQGEFAALRHRLGYQRCRGWWDELDLLAETAHDLSRELERLTVQVSLRAAELESSNISLRTVNEELEHRQRELRQARDQLQQSESVAALGRIAAGMAHEINNALNYTAGALPLFERLLKQLVAPTGDEAAREEFAGRRRKAELLLSNMRSGVQRITAIVRDLADLSRPCRGERRSVDLVREIETALALAEPACEQRITIVRRLSTLPKLTCHPGQIGQLLLNLLTNAVEAIEGRGIIAVAAWREEDGLHLRVSDSGRGIPEEELGRIFDPAFSTKGRGSGLGLAICHNIVRLHGGEIRVTSSEAQGTSFEVLLPLALLADE